jgi:hypothetical protein
MDEWIISDGVMQMFHDNLDFLVVHSLLWPWTVHDKPTLWRDIFPRVIPDRFIMQNPMQSQTSVSRRFPHVGDDPGYHTSAEGQRCIADNWYQRITEDFALA